MSDTSIKGEKHGHTTAVAEEVDKEAAARDRALALLSQEPVIAFDYNSPEARAVKRKIDIHILPLLIITVLLQNLDKATLAYSNILGLSVQTHLTSAEYSWLGSLLYFGFLAWEIPAHFLIQRLPIAKYCGFTVIIWGGIVCCHAACTNFAGLAACRFLLGVAECSVTPAFVIITGAYYTKEEQVNRIALWFGTAAISQIIGGLIAYGAYYFKSSAIKNWQFLYLVLGLITVAYGFALFFLLAASPATSPFLNEHEKRIAIERLRDGKTGTETWSFNKAQLSEAMRDPRLYLFFLIMVCTGLPNGGVGAFGPTIISGFGFSTVQTTLLSMAPGGSELVGIIIATYVARYTRSRAWSGVFALSVAIIGVIMMLAIPPSQSYARYAGYCLLYWWPVCVIFIISWLSSCVSGTTKKLAFNCAYNLGYCVGNILGPQTFRATDAPNYPVAKGVMLAFLIVSAFCLIALWAIHRSWNNKLDRSDRERVEAGLIEEEPLNSEFMDLTDKQQPRFRYPL